MKLSAFRLGFIFAVAAVLCTALGSPSRADGFRPEVRYVQVGDVKLAYYMRGEGKPLVMINGFVSTMSLWDPLLIEELSKNRQLVLFDNRGVGLSTDTVENMTTIPQMADDAAGLIKALGLEKPDVLGWSMGARITQQLLIRHPDLVGKAILAAPNPGGRHSIPADKDVEDKLNNPDLPDEQKLSLLVPPGPENLKIAQEIFGRIQAAAKAGSAPDDFNVSKETTLRQDRARTTLWSADEENFDNLKNIRTPVLVADGRYDVIDKPENSLIIASRIPFSWLAFFEGGHAFLFQDYKRFAQTVDAFLQQPD